MALIAKSLIKKAGEVAKGAKFKIRKKEGKTGRKKKA